MHAHFANTRSAHILSETTTAGEREKIDQMYVIHGLRHSCAPVVDCIFHFVHFRNVFSGELVRAQCLSVRVRRTVVCATLGMFNSAEYWAWRCLCVFVVLSVGDFLWDVCLVDVCDCKVFGVCGLSDSFFKIGTVFTQFSCGSKCRHIVKDTVVRVPGQLPPWCQSSLRRHRFSIPFARRCRLLEGDE